MPAIDNTYIEGFDKVLKQLQDLDKKLRNKHLKKGMTETTRPVLWGAKARTPRKLSILYKSLGRKTKVYRNSGIVVGVIGARQGFKQAIGTRVKGKHAGETYYADPTKYLHLVDLGTVHSRAFRMLEESRDANRQAFIDNMTEAANNAIADAAGGGP